MVIDPTTARRFIKHYQDFLTSIAEPQECRGVTVVQALVSARKRYAADRTLFAQWRAKNSERDADILDAIENIEIGRWIYLKDTRSYSVLLKADAEEAYAVQGLTQRLRDITGYSGIVMEAGVFPLDRHYVCDGLVESVATLGSNYMASFRQEYQTLRLTGRFHQSPSSSSSLNKVLAKPVAAPSATP
ncbi:MAG: hypothetical protein M3R45_09805 [Pseudomonadota bacterium]|nr:hypothetical protein [Pseudomonadota bacterium]